MFWSVENAVSLCGHIRRYTSVFACEKVPDPEGRIVVNDGNDFVYRETPNDGTENRRHLIEASRI